MDQNSIKICVRVRPWHPEKELPYIVHEQNQPFFLGDGNFAASPRRPVGSGSIREAIDVIDHRALLFDKPEAGSEAKRGMPGARRYKNKRYTFDTVFDMRASQEMVFEQTAHPLLDGVLNGYNATVFAYGATGCGKTHTISGSMEDPGVIVRTTRELFNRIEASKDEYDTFIEVSMVEIYNEQIRDLLADDYLNVPVGGLKLLENEKERVTVGGVTLKRPTTVDEVMSLVMLGNERRSTSYTASNSVSSRSHAVLQVNVGRNSRGHQVDVAQELVKQCMTSATLSIIDLAGSERAAATRNMGERMKEGANINKSLLSLSSCITALCQRPMRGVKPHVPYRNSKLTRLLKFSLGGNCRTVMIVCISPNSVHIEDTHNTLVWANRAKEISTSVTQNQGSVQVRAGQWAMALQDKQAEVDRLKMTIAALEKGQRQNNSQRRAIEMADMKRTLDGAMMDVEKHMNDGILAGARIRAEWDGAELGLTAIRGLMSSSTGEELEYLENIVRSQDALFARNPNVVNAVQRESTLRSNVDSIFKGVKARKFGDTMEDVDRENVQLQVQARQAEMERRTLEAREKAHRETVQRQAEAVAKAALALLRVKTGLDEQIAAGQPSTSTLGSIIASTEEALSSLFSSTSTAPLPPLPNPIVALPIVASLPPAQRTAVPTAALSRPRRASTAPGNSSISIKPSFQNSPAAKRLMPARAVASPRKKSMRASLVPVRPARGALKTGTTPRKGVAFKSDNSITEVKEYEVVTSDSGTAGDTSYSGDDSGEWNDEVPELVPKAQMMALPRSRQALAPMPSTAKLAPAPLPPIPLNKPLISLSSSGSESDSQKPPTPEWKKNRRLLRGAMGALDTLGEENSMMSMVMDSIPVDGLPASTATRPMPLGERTMIPPAAPATGLGVSTSSLFKPTLSSASKSNPLPSLGKGSPPGADTKGRRISSLGPTRVERQKHRQSILTSKADSAPKRAAKAGDVSISIGGASALAGGARRMFDGGNSSILKEPTLNRRASSNVLGSAFASGPRASVAGGSLPRGLTSRPSMSTLINKVTGAGGGDAAGRGPWR